MRPREVFVESLSSHVLEDSGAGQCRIDAHLTPMQWKILDGVQSGLLNKQIAFGLGIAEATVKAHMTALMRKLKVRNRTQVALAAQTLKRQNRSWAPG
jgi:Response regulator containing a CheY-like receiver domain and an HTH DNA-binding domain